MPLNDLVFHVQLHIKTDCIEEWRRLLDTVIDRMSQEDTFVSCYLSQSLENENLFTLYETWKEPSVQAFLENQMGKDYRKQYEGALSVLLETPRTALVSRHLAEWRK